MITIIKCFFVLFLKFIGYNEKSKKEKQMEELKQEEIKVIEKQSNLEVIVLYSCAILGYLTAGLGFIVAVILAYIIRNKSDSTQYSLSRYYIRTFWISIGLTALFSILSLVAIGIPLLIGLSIWALYRIIKGLYYSIKYIDPYPPKIVKE